MDYYARHARLVTITHCSVRFWHVEFHARFLLSNKEIISNVNTFMKKTKTLVETATHTSFYTIQLNPFFDCIKFCNFLKSF